MKASRRHPDVHEKTSVIAARISSEETHADSHRHRPTLFGRVAAKVIKARLRAVTHGPNITLLLIASKPFFANSCVAFAFAYHVDPPVFDWLAA